jgi:hypothetical protein
MTNSIDFAVVEEVTSGVGDMRSDAGLWCGCGTVNRRGSRRDDPHLSARRGFTTIRYSLYDDTVWSRRTPTAHAHSACAWRRM